MSNYNKYYNLYIRKDPRRDAKCSPLLWGDNYKPYFRSLTLNNDCLNKIEQFTNVNQVQNKNIQVVNNRNINNRIYLNQLNSDGIGTERYDPNEDNYSYNLELKDKKTTKMACLGGKTFIEINDNGNVVRQMYDIDPKSLMKKEVIGDIQEIDSIHNDKIKTSMNYDKMRLNHLNKTMSRIHNSMNNSMLHMHTRNFLNDDFFKD
tara:strand:+ start:2047 stop:2661 length:615 start_codon:yes stop_codon:yes gene_type:complete